MKQYSGFWNSHSWRWWSIRLSSHGNSRFRLDRRQPFQRFSKRAFRFCSTSDMGTDHLRPSALTGSLAAAPPRHGDPEQSLCKTKLVKVRGGHAGRKCGCVAPARRLPSMFDITYVLKVIDASRSSKFVSRKRTTSGRSDKALSAVATASPSAHVSNRQWKSTMSSYSALSNGASAAKSSTWSRKWQMHRSFLAKRRPQFSIGCAREEPRI